MQLIRLIGRLPLTLLQAAFFLIMTPAACVLRLAGRDRLDRAVDPAASSYWRPRPDDGAIDLAGQS